MSSTRFDIDKFTGRNDFGLWQVNILSLLVQQGVEDAIEDCGVKLDQEGKDNWLKASKKARSIIFLSLGDKVLREVAKEESAYDVWKKLEGLYMTKSLANRLFMKQKLYTYRFVDGKETLDSLDDFTKILDDLENIGVKTDDEDKAIHLLNALPSSMKTSEMP